MAKKTMHMKNKYSFPDPILRLGKGRNHSACLNTSDTGKTHTKSNLSPHQANNNPTRIPVSSTASSRSGPTKTIFVPNAA